jgi:hypothetical protein
VRGWNEQGEEDDTVKQNEIKDNRSTDRWRRKNSQPQTTGNTRCRLREVVDRSGGMD